MRRLLSPLCLAVALAGGPAIAGAQAADLVVGGPDGLPTIAEAVRQAAPGALIRVTAGTYEEGVIVLDRPVTIQGQGWPTVIADGTGGLFLVTADSVTIRGLVLRGVPSSHIRDHAAILFDDVTACEASGNRLENNFFGIYLARARDCVVRDNVIEASERRETSAGNGIHLWNARRVTIENNRVRGQRDGIYLEHVEGTTIRGNLSEDNVRYGLHFMFSSDNRYVGNTFRRNGAGVAVMYSNNVVIEDNTFADNWGPTAYGLLLKEISDSRIEGNRIIGNTTGLSSQGSQRIEVIGNRFIRNGWATRVFANSQDNLFSANSFIDNTFDVTTNSRQNFNRFDGNYWSRYTGYDLTGDGIGDVPHRPVRLFSLLVERTPAALVLLRSAFVDLLDIAERVAPILTPETLVDERPLMREARP
jgi:nitrous oxidase accessory protein